MSTDPSHARPRGDLLGVVPSPQPVALLASRRAINLAAYQAIGIDHFWTRIELKLSVRCSMRSPPPATERVMADFSCASTKRTSHWSAPMS